MIGEWKMKLLFPLPHILPVSHFKNISETALLRWTDSHIANQLLLHWFCHQARKLRKDLLLCCSSCCLFYCVFFCVGVCVCVSVCVCMCMQILGLSYLEANAQHSIMWTSQQQCRTEEKQHPLIDGPLEEQTWINGREEPFCFFNLLYLVPSSKRAKGLSSLSSAILLSPAWCPLPSSLPSLFNPPLTFFLRLLLEY